MFEIYLRLSTWRWQKILVMCELRMVTNKGFLGIYARNGITVLKESERGLLSVTGIHSTRQLKPVLTADGYIVGL
jgi:hypothetical protein